ncbi:glycoside hydrolase family 27 protein [[Clostridium] polysaccharolyticum]|nr:glycoside hydrolase family 27 protein [[Clostridium] polysaccharolyticum]
MNKNQFCPLPPMGWNSYDYYDTTVDEEAVRNNAKYMAQHLKDYGWNYIVIDIQWYAQGAGTQRDKHQYIPFSQLEMDSYSRLLPDPERFPSSKNGAGFKPLADDIHNLGLKFGIHIMRGIPRIAAHHHTPVLGCSLTANEIADPSSICGWNPDMYGVRNTEEGQRYYDSLLELYASWGVDFIKCDDICNTNMYKHNPYSAKHEIEMLAHAIDKCGRPIVLSLSPGPALIEQSFHYEKYANMWRITDDFWDNWDLLKDMFHRCALWKDHVKEGCYPDCDMLPLGYLGKGFGHERQTRFTQAEQRTMMTLWCLFGSPLMIGAELTKLDSWTLSLLTNDAILNLRTPHCKPALLELNDCFSIWTVYNEIEKNAYVALFNLRDTEMEFSVSREELLNSFPENIDFTQLKELWAGQLKPCTDAVICTSIAAHDTCIYQLL